jgi:hypothetical protein
MGVVWRQPQPVRRSGKDAVAHFGRDSRQLRPEERDEHERRRVSGTMSPMAMDMDYSMLAEHSVDSETFLNWFDNLEWETMHQPVPLQV